MFFAVYQANSSRSACTRKGHGSNLVHAWAFHTGYSQAHWGFSDCCFEVDKDIRQNTLWKTCARWCHHCWTRRNVALSRVKKNKLWIWKAYRRETGELIDWECGGRDKGTLSKLMERLSRWKVELFCTDNWGVYPEVIVADKLYQSKSQTVYLEQNNGRQRHWFARFRRKSIVVSKTLEMVDLTMALFARFHVNGSWKDIASLFSWHPQKRYGDVFAPYIDIYGSILKIIDNDIADHVRCDKNIFNDRYDFYLNIIKKRSWIYRYHFMLTCFSVLHLRGTRGKLTAFLQRSSIHVFKKIFSAFMKKGIFLGTVDFLFWKYLLF